MEITSWVPDRAMGVRHVGMVTGTGEFTLTDAPGGRTRFTWEERCASRGGWAARSAPWSAARCCKLIWARNLKGLKAIVEGR